MAVLVAPQRVQFKGVLRKFYALIYKNKNNVDENYILNLINREICRVQQQN